MMKCDGSRLVAEYVEWLEQRFKAVEAEEGVCEITTPFLDRHNDRIVIYVQPIGGGLRLTDDSYMLEDLAMSGVELTQKRREILRTVLNGFGVQMTDDGELYVDTTVDSFTRKKHDFIQALLVVNDMFMLGQEYVRGLFFEEVERFLDQHEVRFVMSVRFTGRSGIDHTFDFVVPPHRGAPEKLIQAIGTPEKQTIVARLLFPHLDLREMRPVQYTTIGVLNDERPVRPELLSSMVRTGVQPILWSQRNEHIEQLTA